MRRERLRRRTRCRSNRGRAREICIAAASRPGSSARATPRMAVLRPRVAKEGGLDPRSMPSEERGKWLSCGGSAMAELDAPVRRPARRMGGRVHRGPGRDPGHVLLDGAAFCARPGRPPPPYQHQHQRSSTFDRWNRCGARRGDHHSRQRATPARDAAGAPAGRGGGRRLRGQGRQRCCANSSTRSWVLRRDSPRRRPEGQDPPRPLRFCRAQPCLGGSRPRWVIVVVVDADGRLDPDAPRFAAAHFEDPEVGGVQALVHIYNRNRR